ncbi:MAG: hypothetical protein ACRD2B_14920 [Terriglobia bacterium]
MKKTLLTLTILSLFAVWGSVAGFAKPSAQATSSSSSQAATTTHHHHVHHRAAAPNLTAKYAHGVQELSGTLSMVDAGQKVVVITNSDGTPFDFKVTRRTRIEVNGQKANLDSLSDQTSKQASIKYRDALNRGLLAETIQLSE